MTHRPLNEVRHRRADYGDLSRYDLRIEDAAFAMTCQDCDVVVVGFIGEGLPLRLDVLVRAASQHEIEMDEDVTIASPEDSPRMSSAMWWHLVHRAKSSTDRGVVDLPEQTTTPRQPEGG